MPTQSEERPPSRRGRSALGLLALASVVLLLSFCFLFRQDLEQRYRLWRDFEPLGRNAQGYREYHHVATGIVFVRLPGGAFDMGLSPAEAERILAILSEGRGDVVRKRVREYIRPTQPKHRVVLSSFLIAKYETTQKEWTQVLGTASFTYTGEALPAVGVTWDAAREFCRTNGFALPSEAQWEYACRAGTETPFAFGEELAVGQANVEETRGVDIGGEGSSILRRPVPVRSFVPNGFGLHQMHGNVFEWCEDILDSRFYAKSPRRDPVCRSGSKLRVYRGGAWYLPRLLHASWQRMGGAPAGVHIGAGLRPVFALR